VTENLVEFFSESLIPNPNIRGKVFLHNKTQFLPKITLFLQKNPFFFVEKPFLFMQVKCQLILALFCKFLFEHFSSVFFTKYVSFY
jgi:hypothetical protein